jgi:hypothetical protein
MTKEEIIELMVQASKWGSWAYDTKQRDRLGKINLEDFKKWREEVMDELYETKSLFIRLNQNEDD